MKKRDKNLFGFTLFEVLVTMAVIVLLSSLLIANLNKGEKQYQIQLAAQEIVQNLRRAQDMALTSFKPQGENVPDYYGIFFDKDDLSSYLVFGDKDGNGTYQSSDIEIETVSIEFGIEINSLSSGNKNLQIIFLVPDGFTYIKPDAESAIITIKKAGADCLQVPKSCRNIIISKTGQIHVENL